MSSAKQVRLANLRKLISENRSLHVKAAADQLNVSEMTIRRDIRDNPTEFNYLGGHIVAVEGRMPYDLGAAIDVNNQAKKQASAHCLPLIQAGDVIFVDCGTTLVHLIDLLPNTMPLTVVCYAMNVADRALRKPNVKMVLIGGEYHSQTASFSLLKDDSSYDALAISTAFLSAAGLDNRLGATCSSFHEAKQKRAAIQRAKKKILVIDSSKFGKSSPAHFADTDDFDQIVTENGTR